MSYINQLLSTLKIFVGKSRYVSSLKQKILWRIYFKKISKKISGRRNKIELHTSLLWKLNISISGSDNYISIEGNAVAKNTKIRIAGNNNRIHIGFGAIFKSGLILIEGSNNTANIGSRTTIEHAEFHITEKDCSITIGADCMLASNIIFRNGDSHPIYDRNSGVRLNNAGSISIGDHVWIGQDVLILKNTSIPLGSIIGAKSLVNKAFSAEHSIFAGIPAKIVKENVSWKRDRE